MAIYGGTKRVDTLAVSDPISQAYLASIKESNEDIETSVGSTVEYSRDLPVIETSVGSTLEYSRDLPSIDTRVGSSVEYGRYLGNELPSIDASVGSSVEYNRNLPTLGSIDSYVGSSVEYNRDLPSIDAYVAAIDGNTLTAAVELPQISAQGEATVSSYLTGAGGVLGAATLKRIIVGERQSGVVSVMDGLVTVAVLFLEEPHLEYDFHNLSFGALEIWSNAVHIGSGITVLYT